jgi:hypothetical protein
MHLASQSNLNAVAFLRRAVRLFIHATSPRCVSGDRRSSEYQVSGRIVGAHPSKPPVSPRCNPRRLPDGRWGWCVPTSAVMSNARRGELYSEDARCDHMVGEYFQESAVVCATESWRNDRLWKRFFKNVSRGRALITDLKEIKLKSRAATRLAVYIRNVRFIPGPVAEPTTTNFISESIHGFLFLRLLYEQCAATFFPKQ